MACDNPKCPCGPECPCGTDCPCGGRETEHKCDKCKTYLKQKQNKS